MIRLRNVTTGAVVQVRDDKAPLLGTEWAPVDEPVRPKKAPAKPTK